MCVAQEEMWDVLDVGNLSVSERRMQRTGRTTSLKIERGKGLLLQTMKEENMSIC
jgi:hypothetical protein